MNGPITALIALIAVGGIGAAVYVGVQPSVEQKLIASCEEIIASRLKAPSTYRQISTTKITKAKADFNQFMGWDVPGVKEHDAEVRRSDPAIMEIQDNQKKMFSGVEWTRYSTWIEYDAANSYGTPVRGAAECVLFARASEPFTVGPLSDVRVDGFDALGWSVHQIWLARQ